MDESTLTLQIDASKVDDLEETAKAVYAEIRELAGLSVDRKPNLALIALVWGVPLDADEHIFEAQRLQREQRFETAIIEAQMFFELHLRQDIEAVAAAHGDIVLALARGQRNWTLLDPSSQRLFTILFDTRPASFERWKDYRAHVERRNEIVHRGLRASAETTEESIDVVVAFHRRVRALRDAALEANSHEG